MNVLDKATTVAETKYVHDKLQGEIDIIAGIVKVESWADVQKIVRAGMASKIFSIGDQLTCQRGNNTLVWDIIGIDHDTPADPQFTHSLTLQLHYCFPTAMQFDAPEAFYYAENGLEAGTYHFKIDSAYGSEYQTFNNYQFTLANAVPAGGQLRFDWSYNTQASAAKVISYASATSTTVIEQVAVSEGTDGTNLGTLTAAGDFGNNLNAINRVRYGSNNYKESAIRQWLGSSAAADSVWTPQTKFDRPPSWISTEDGFMRGMDADFLAVIGKTHIVVARNTVCDGGGFDEMDDYFFFLSRSEVYAPSISDVDEVGAYPYYANYSDLLEPSSAPDTNRLKYTGYTSRSWYTRTPYLNGVSNIYTVRNTNGSIFAPEYGTSFVAPACNII